jgi:succinate-acetate transporter protein
MEAGTAGTGGGIAPPPRTAADGGLTKRVLNITADPGPLGLAGFALTTFVLSMFNAGLVNKAGEPVVLGLALAYGGLAQFTAGIWAFRRGDTFAALAFTSYGAFWLSYWALVTFYAKTIPETHAGAAIGLFLWAWGIFTVLLWIGSFSRTAAVNAVLFALAVTFILLGIGNSGADESIVKAGGWAGLVTAALAWYAALGELLEASYGRAVLPLIPLRKGGAKPSLGEVHRDY